jgi:hypothetical protein
MTHPAPAAWFPIALTLGLASIILRYPERLLSLISANSFSSASFLAFPIPTIGWEQRVIVGPLGCLQLKAGILPLLRNSKQDLSS